MKAKEEGWERACRCGPGRTTGGAFSPVRPATLGRVCFVLAIACLLVAPTPCRASGNRDLLTITAVGDIMMGTTYPAEKLPPGDGKTLLVKVRDNLRGSDITFGNLEAPFIEEGTASKCGRDPAGGNRCYEFRMPPRYAAYLAAAGFNVVSVANNHIRDFGAEGFASTLQTLRAARIQAAGGRRVAHFHIKGRKVAVAGFSFSDPPSAGSILYPERAAKTIRGLKKNNDIVVVSFHGGGEGGRALHVSNVAEEYAGEMRGNVMRFSRMAVDAGADMVLGHGPHVPRALEVYKGKLIAYSLGSFLVYRKFNLDGPAGVSLVLKAAIDAKTGNLVSGRMIPLTLRKDGIPSVDDGQTSIRLVKELTEKDLGPSAMLVKDDGRFFPPGPLSAGSSRLRSLLDYLKKIFNPSSSRP